MVDLQKIKNEAIEKFEDSCNVLQEFGESRCASVKIQNYHATLSLNQQERLHLGEKGGAMKLKIYRIPGGKKLLICLEEEK